MAQTMTESVRRLAEQLTFRLPDRTREFVVRHGLFLLNWSGLRQFPAVLLRGPTHGTGRPARLLLVGHEPWAQYLPQRFFAGDPTRELLGQVRVRALPEFLDTFQQSADLTIVRVDRQSGRRIFGEDYLAVPEWVGTKLVVPENLDMHVRNGGSIRRDMTLVRRHGYQPVLSSGREEVEVFYHSFYLPFTHGRYGESAFVRTVQDLRRRVRRGGILWIQRAGCRVAAILFELHGSAVDLLALGTLKGDLELVKEGAIAALYYFIIELARTRGYQFVDFRGSRPSLCDGLLRYKSKWGVTLYDKADSYHDLFVRWGQVNEVVKEFLSHTPLIFREEGRLSAIHADESQNYRSLWVGGLHRLYLLTESGRQPMTDEGASLSTAGTGPDSQQVCQGAK
jgi:hypothetical protein